MADLSQFLNSGGSHSRIVSGNGTSIPDGQSITISPATDEFIVLWGRAINSPGVAISVTGRGAINLSTNTGDDSLPIVLGLGEEVVVSNSSGSAKSYSYRIYEEYK